MKEFLPENKHPLNQLSKFLLKKVKAEIWPDAPYCLQLALWALENGYLRDTRQGVLEENVRTMLGWNPKNFMDFLLNRQEDWEEDILWQLNLKERNDPVEVARAILEQLDSRLTEVLPNYP